MSTGKKKGLGRGLSALFGDQIHRDKSIEKNEINKVSISDLSRNPYQPRQIFNEVKLEELSNSIKKNGIIQPIAVRSNKLEPGKFEPYVCLTKPTTIVNAENEIFQIINQSAHNSSIYLTA